MNTSFEELPSATSALVSEIEHVDKKRGKVLHRYYSEMKRVLKEMYRVLKPNNAAIVVVGNSTMRDRDTQTQNCLAEIGQEIGFGVPKMLLENWIVIRECCLQELSSIRVRKFKKECTWNM